MIKFRSVIFTLILLNLTVFAFLHFNRHADPFHKTETVRNTKIQSKLLYPSSPTPYLKKNWQDLLKEDELCELVVAIDQTPHAELFKAVMAREDKFHQDPDLDRILESLYEKTYSTFPIVDSEPQGKFVLDFYNALTTSGLLRWRWTPKGPPDLDAGSRFLSIVAQEEPSNGIVPLFRAVDEHDTQTEQEQIILFEEAFAAPKFNSYSAALKERIFQRGFGSASYFLLAKKIINDFPDLLYERPRSKLMGYIDFIDLTLEQPSDASKESYQENVRFLKQAIAFGERIMEPGIRAHFRVRETEWSLKEFEFGRHLAHEAWHKLHEGDDSTASWNTAKFTYPNAELEQQANADLNKRTCDRKKFDELFKRELEEYRSLH